MNTSSLVVFFDTSTLSEPELWKTYVRAIVDSNASSIHDWSLYSQQWDNNSPREDRRALYASTLKSIGSCDLAIFDVTVPSMRIGHEITIALGRAIPVLVLVNKQQRRPDSLFLQAVSSPHLQIKSYSDSFDFLMQIRLFLRTYHTGVKKRLDIDLERDLHEFVSREAQRKGITKTEMLHRILKKG